MRLRFLLRGKTEMEAHAKLNGVAWHASNLLFIQYNEALSRVVRAAREALEQNDPNLVQLMAAPILSQLSQAGGLDRSGEL